MKPYSRGNTLNRHLRSLLAILLSFSASGISAQEAQQLPRLVETVNVRVINVDVVVTDKRGKPIQGLKMSDFEIYENGKPQPVTNFYEVSGRETSTATVPVATGTATTAAAATTAPAAPSQSDPDTDTTKRKIIYFIDNLSLNPLNRNNVFKSMKKFAKESMRPGDEAMIATWNRSIKTRVPFTRDPAVIIQELDGIARESASGLQNLSERRSSESRIREARSYEEAISTARSYAQSVEHDLRQTVTALNGLMATLAGVEGKKIMVLTSEGLPMSPGREMFFFIDDISREKPEWQRGSSMIEGMSFDSSLLIQSIARTANANGITLYTLHAGGLGAGMESNSAENQQPTGIVVQQAALSNSTDSLNLLADMTGGLAAIGTNNFPMAFSRITQDLGAYYSLGYRSTTERVDRQRSIQVKVRNKGYIVRSRRTFVEKSIPTEMTDRVVANLFYINRANDLKIVMKTGIPVAVERDRFQVPVEVHIPMDNLTLIQQGEVLVGGFSVYIGVADDRGDMSDVNQQSHRLNFPLAEAEKMKGKDYVYSVALIMAKGLNKISIGVVDEISNTTGFDRRPLMVKDLR
ncbi:MAG TPA: VWA domain-containing protein [Thermoanaerobaculia bacterium]|nr:VWA domain-containing protein [Thermoanaerobaculia bacterium]